MGDAAFEFLDDVTSDLSFVARGRTLEECFANAAEALLAATVTDPARVEARERVPVELEEEDLDLLLFSFLNELVFLRDAEGLLLRAERLEIDASGERPRLTGVLAGEPLDPARHELGTEVKAVTAHGLRVARTPEGWEARVTVDV